MQQVSDSIWVEIGRRGLNHALISTTEELVLETRLRSRSLHRSRCDCSTAAPDGYWSDRLIAFSYFVFFMISDKIFFARRVMVNVRRYVGSWTDEGHLYPNVVE